MPSLAHLPYSVTHAGNDPQVSTEHQSVLPVRLRSVAATRPPVAVSADRACWGWGWGAGVAPRLTGPSERNKGTSRAERTRSGQARGLRVPGGVVDPGGKMAAQTGQRGASVWPGNATDKQARELGRQQNPSPGSAGRQRRAARTAQGRKADSPRPGMPACRAGEPRVQAPPEGALTLSTVPPRIPLTPSHQINMPRSFNSATLCNALLANPLSPLTFVFPTNPSRKSSALEGPGHLLAPYLHLTFQHPETSTTPVSPLTCFVFCRWEGSQTPSLPSAPGTGFTDAAMYSAGRNVPVLFATRHLDLRSGGRYQVRLAEWQEC
ncbi:hypothetical protein CB1_000707032 [Camelus ferus]|nr:hypothetical protein CB1_000707032 [Camelus ferus]